MRRDAQYLADILDAADAIRRFLADTTKKQFLENELLQSALLQSGLRSDRTKISKKGRALQYSEKSKMRGLHSAVEFQGC